jgi:hypothetical protein
MRKCDSQPCPEEICGAVSVVYSVLGVSVEIGSIKCYAASSPLIQEKVNIITRKYLF